MVTIKIFTVLLEKRLFKECICKTLSCHPNVFQSIPNITSRFKDIYSWLYKQIPNDSHSTHNLMHTTDIPSIFMDSFLLHSSKLQHLAWGLVTSQLSALSAAIYLYCLQEWRAWKKLAKCNFCSWFPAKRQQDQSATGTSYTINAILGEPQSSANACTGCACWRAVGLPLSCIKESVSFLKDSKCRL